jgi:acyl-coenzyme A synthetase/AMP-(fatty) acid ligase
VNTVGTILHFGATCRERAAIIEGSRTISYGDLADEVRRTAGRLYSLGIRRGHRVGVCLKDTSDHIVSLLAAAFLGSAIVPLDWRARASENERFIKALELDCVLVEPDGQLGSGCKTIVLDEEWHRAVSRGNGCDSRETNWSDVFVIAASSGSTGHPKFTVMTHQQYHFAVSGMLELMDFSGPQRFLCNLPLYYSGGRNSCIAHLLRGDCIVLYSSLFHPAEFIEIVTQQQITTAALVPSMVRQLLNSVEKEPLFPRLSKMFSLGAPLHAEEKRQGARKLTPNFHERYGTAETLAISVLKPGDFADRADSVGQTHSLVEMEVVDENDQLLPTGATGSLRLRGPGVASPLVGQSSEASFRDGWYRPGEIARVDEAGYIFLQGRASDVIMRSGAKVYPAEVEAVLAEHAGVAEAAVLGRTGIGGDEDVIAFVVARGNLQVGELLAHCRVRLTPHKVPRQIRIVGSFPRNTAGKVDKASLLGTMEAQAEN